MNRFFLFIFLSVFCISGFSQKQDSIKFSLEETRKIANIISENQNLKRLELINDSIILTQEKIMSKKDSIILENDQKIQSYQKTYQILEEQSKYYQKKYNKTKIIAWIVGGVLVISNILTLIYR